VHLHSKTNSLLAPLAIALLGVGVTACGGASRGASPASQVSSSTATASAPATASTSTTPTSTDAGTNAIEREAFSQSEATRFRTYGREASEADRQAVTAAVKHYYAVLATGDGAKGCSLLRTELRKAAREDYGTSPPGPPELRGKNCPEIVLFLFKHLPRLPGESAAAIEVTGVRVNGDVHDMDAVALLRSKATPSSEILVDREHGLWKMNSLIGSPLP
jgi:ketosteroid isomerase-like protein